MMGSKMSQGFPGGGAMLFSNIPEPLQAVAQDIANDYGGYQNVWHIVATLKGTDGYELIVPKITKLSIHEEFETKICDFINISVMVPIEEMRLLEKSYRALKCKLDFYTADPEQGVVSNSAGIHIDWYAVLRNRGSIYRNATPNQLNNIAGEALDKQQLVEIELVLTSPGSLNLRNKKVAGVFRDTNVTDMIYWVSHYFGAKNINMRPAQNEEEYENFILEPMHYMNDVFDYIQNRYGVYQYGISVYYYGLDEFDSVLYIYPPYMYNPPLQENDIPTEIIYVGNRNLRAGFNTSKRYNADGETITFNDKQIEITGGLKIICSDIVDQISPGDYAADTYGTISLTFNANRIIDKWRKIEEDDEYRCIPMHKDNVMDGMSDRDQGLLGFARFHYNPRYDVSYNNAYVISSNLTRYNCDVITLRWHGALPWTLKPGKPITFTYSESNKNEPTRLPCICSEIVYGFTPVKGAQPGVDYFECFADLILKLKRIK